MKNRHLTTRHGVVVLALIACIAVVAWYALREQTASSRPELDLVYPGSVVVTKQDSDTATRLMLGSSASVEEILGFYLTEVRSRGFLYGGSTARIKTSTETFACAWHDGDTILRLAFIDPKVLARYMEVPTGYATLYRWSVIDQTASESSRPCSILLDDVPASS